MRKNLVILFYFIFILLGSASVVFIPDAMRYEWGSMVSILVILIPLAYFLIKEYGWLFCIHTLTILSIYAMTVEYIGLTTGIPYGDFIYTGNLGYKIHGILPITVGLSWAPLLLGSIAITYTITKNKIYRFFLPAIILVAFDMILDPASIAIGMWKYSDAGLYYGVPVQNFIGWVISGSIGSIFGYWLFYKRENKNILLLSYSFLISIIFWTLVSIFKELWIPATIGIGMIIIYAVIHYKNAENIKNK
jgi:bisanhydrobacterioruberin hydratase